MAQYEFQTEVSQLLTLIIHSLYSHKEIFLRELISNASDALDKLKYEALVDGTYKQLHCEARIDIAFEEDAQRLVVRDTGIGMNAEDLRANLGTIARSGTKAFLSTLTRDQKQDSNLIGQFGVGFYSAFMVASKVEVITKKAAENTVWKWTSEGQNAYTLDEVDAAAFPVLEGVAEGSAGTCVVLHLSQENSEFATRWRLEEVIKKYSDHIAFPIYLHYLQKEYDKDGAVTDTQKKVDQVNDAGALWKRPKSELKEEDYHRFYQTLTRDSTPPLLYVHTKAEGTQEYVTLFYVPAKAPFDLFHADYKPGVKLFVKRVFITDDEKELLPVYLRFVRGVIDSEDLPLNVSREILQQNRVLAAIKSASVKKLLGEFKRLAECDGKKYDEFITQYNRPLKEGLYSDYEHREQLLELVRFRTLSESVPEDGWTSFAEYVSRMKPDQKAIYYIAGNDDRVLRQSPHAESYRLQGFEVLVMSDDIDGIVMPSVSKYKEWELRAINRLGSEEELRPNEETDAAAQREQGFKPLLERLTHILSDSVKEVRLSKRLSDSVSCIVIDENDPTVQMERLMRATGQTHKSKIKQIGRAHV